MHIAPQFNVLIRSREKRKKSCILTVHSFCKKLPNLLAKTYKLQYSLLFESYLTNTCRLPLPITPASSRTNGISSILRRQFPPDLSIFHLQKPNHPENPQFHVSQRQLFYFRNFFITLLVTGNIKTYFNLEKGVNKAPSRHCRLTRSKTCLPFPNSNHCH